jgi:hypothetical protein
MPAEPLNPEEQAEVDTVTMLHRRIERRGSYSTAFGDALKALNGLCARIFNRPEDDAPARAGEESW